MALPYPQTPNPYGALGSGLGVSPGSIIEYKQGSYAQQQAEREFSRQRGEAEYYRQIAQQQMQAPQSPSPPMPCKGNLSFIEELQEETNEWLKDTI